MSSKYRRKQQAKLRKTRQQTPEKETKVVHLFRDEWDAMIFLVDFGVEVEYGGEIYIPHDHLPIDAIVAVDYLVDMGYKPMPTSAKPIGPTTSDYVKDGMKFTRPEKGDPDDDV